MVERSSRCLTSPSTQHRSKPNRLSAPVIDLRTLVNPVLHLFDDEASQTMANEYYGPSLSACELRKVDFLICSRTRDKNRSFDNRF